MEPILVPGPPKEAFNKNRRISDLIRAQVNHLKHIEYKLPANVRQGIPHHEITTEDDAARYIAPMTRLLRAQAAAVPQVAPAAPTAASVKQPTSIRPAQGLALAAGAEDATAASKSKNPWLVNPPLRSRKRPDPLAQGKK